ncbi:hypothetical protein EBO15_42540, partial [Actinomadura harenae]
MRLITTAEPVGERRRRGGRVFLYLVGVRPVGGVARGASLALAAERPLSWAGRASACAPGQDRAELSCPLGDLSDRRMVPIAVRVPGKHAARNERRAAVPHVVIVARAGNASEQTVLSLTPREDGPTSGPTVTGNDQQAPASGPAKHPKHSTDPASEQSGVVQAPAPDGGATPDAGSATPGQPALPPASAPAPAPATP